MGAGERGIEGKKERRRKNERGEKELEPEAWKQKISLLDVCPLQILREKYKGS